MDSDMKKMLDLDIRFCECVDENCKLEYSHIDEYDILRYGHTFPHEGKEVHPGARLIVREHFNADDYEIISTSEHLYLVRILGE